MAVNAQLNIDTTSTVVQTTDGSTSTTIYNQAAFQAVDGGQIVTFDVCGFDFDNAEVATAKVVVKLKNVAGTVSMVGSPVHLVPINAGSSAGLTSASVNVVISGSNIKVNVIGVTGRTIDWTCNRAPSLSVLDPWTAAPTPGDGYVLAWDSATSRWEASENVPLAGDVIGTITNTVVDNITGVGGFVDINAVIRMGSNASQFIWHKDSVAPEFRQYQLDSTASTPGLDGTPFYITGQYGQPSSTGTGGKGASVIIKGGEGGSGVNAASNGVGGDVTIAAGTGGGSVAQGIVTIQSSGNYVQVDGNGTTIDGPVLLTTTSTTATPGAAGGANALPATPAGYLRIYLEGNERLIPYYLP